MPAVVRTLAALGLAAACGCASPSPVGAVGAPIEELPSPEQAASPSRADASGDAIASIAVFASDDTRAPTPNSPAPDAATPAGHEDVNDGQDPTRPLPRFDARVKYTRFRDEPVQRDQWLTTLRGDAPFPLGGGWTLAARAELPVVHDSNVPSAGDNPGGERESGLGDALVQALFIAPQENRCWNFAVGTQVILPTATQEQFGAGKWQVAPSFAFVGYPQAWSKGSFLGLVLRDQFDVAGDDDRPDVHQAVIQPMVNFSFSGGWFVSSAPEMRIDWKDENHWFIPADLTIGKLLSRSVVVSVEGRRQLADAFHQYEWEVEFRIGFFF